MVVFLIYGDTGGATNNTAATNTEHYLTAARVEIAQCYRTMPVLMAGDLNAPPGHAVHRLLLSRGLADELKWFGVWAATWPSGGGWPNLPYYQLDQVLSGGIDVQNISFHRLPGSDHKALAMDLLF